MPIDAIVAGAGIWGCTVAWRLAEAWRKVPVLEECNVVGEIVVMMNARQPYAVSFQPVETN